MTPAELNAIRERVEKATPGPWAYDDGITDDSFDPPERGKCQSIETRRAEVVAFPAGMFDLDQDDANGRFIAAARQDIPALLAEVNRLNGMMAPKLDLTTKDAAPTCGRIAESGWVRIGFWDSALRRALWLRMTFDTTNSVRTTIELCAGREGNDAYVKIERDNPQFYWLMEVLTSANTADGEIAQDERDLEAEQAAIDGLRTEVLMLRDTVKRYGAALKCRCASPYPTPEGRHDPKCQAYELDP